MVETIERTAREVFMPLTVGGGIFSIEDMRAVLLAGADKTSLNTAAVKDPTLITRGAEAFGNQCVVLAVDAKRRGEDSWEVYINGGHTPTGLDALEWVKKPYPWGRGKSC